MLCKVAVNIIRRSICNNARILYYVQNSAQSALMSCHNNIKQCNVQNNYDIHVIKRFKSHKKRTVDNVINIIIYLYFHLYYYYSFVEFLHIRLKTFFNHYRKIILMNLKVTMKVTMK
jgi:hypothetical protein